MADRCDIDSAAQAAPSRPQHRRVDGLAFRIQVPALAVHVAAIRHAVVESATAYGLSRELRADIALAVSEACANVVMHAYRGATGPGPLTVETRTGSEEFVIVVSDEGIGMGPRPDSPGLGHGLILITRLTQRLEIGVNGSGGAKLTMGFATV